MRASPRKVWTGADKRRVVTEAPGLSGSAPSAFLRREDLHEAQLVACREAAEVVLGAPGRLRPGSSPDEKRIQTLERDLRWKNQALTETTVLLILKKKRPRHLRRRGQYRGPEEQTLIQTLIANVRLNPEEHAARQDACVT